MCSGNKDTRSLRCILYLKNIHFDSLSRLEGLTLHLLILSKDCICLAKIYAYIMSYHTLYNAGNNLFLIAVILVKQNFSLFLTDFLKDYVLCILCCNTAKFVRVNRYTSRYRQPLHWYSASVLLQEKPPQQDLLRILQPCGLHIH